MINARDAVQGAGHIRICLDNREVDASQLLPGETLPAGDYVAVSVSDDGIGMTQEVQARAFEPFFTTKQAGAGTGLGLSQTYGFVTQSGGIIRIHSTPGQGTTIEMLLPRALGTPTPAHLPTHSAGGG